jgi:serine/threonine protein kinase
MSSIPHQFISSCPICQGQIDVSSLEPFSKIKCPYCSALIRVRRKFDHFVIIRQIGEGGMSKVFEAEDENLSRRVALKILNKRYISDINRVNKFRQEANITGSVTHPNVVKLYSMGFDQGYFYIAMELVSGGSLEQRIRKVGTLSETEVLKIGTEATEALRACAEEGMIHRDVKPANILFTDQDVIKVVDFGLAIFTDQLNNDNGELWATPYYVSPEKVISGEEDFRSDMFSLGATLYHALIGSPPHNVDSNSVSELRKVKAKPIQILQPPTPLHPRTIKLIHNMTAFRPQERYDSYDELLSALHLTEGIVSQKITLKKNKTGLLIIASIILILGLFYASYFERILHKQKKSFVQTDELSSTELNAEDVEVISNKTISKRYLTARHAMINQGQYQFAIEQFYAIANNPETKQPTLAWALFNQGLCEMILGKKDNALGCFNKLKLTKKNSDSDLITPKQILYFQNLGNCISKNLSNQHSDDPHWNTQDEEIIGFLTLGLSCWYNGEMSIGSHYIDVFNQHIQNISISDDLKITSSNRDWLLSYKKLLIPWLKDIEFSKTIPSRQSHQNSKQMEHMLTLLIDASHQCTNNSPLQKAIELRIADLKINLFVEQNKQKMIDQQNILKKANEELIQINNLWLSLQQQCQYFQYQEILTILQQISPTSQPAKFFIEEKIQWIKDSQSLIDSLILWLQKNQPTLQIALKNQKTIYSKWIHATTQSLDYQYANQITSIPLSTVEPLSLIPLLQKSNENATDTTAVLNLQKMILSYKKLHTFEKN